MSPLLLCTDLDRTLLPNGEAPESPRARPLFRRLVAEPDVTLVYVTGRDRGLVAAAVAEYDLPDPDHLIADVGTTIIGPDGRRWTDWDEHIARDWNGADDAKIARLAGDVTGVTLQEPSRQGRFKISFEVRPAALTEEHAAAIAAKLEAKGLAASVVASRDDPADVGLLDILPAAAGKAEAVEFLREHLGFARADTLYAGDSGNDLDVLTGPLPAVLVANATPAMKEAARTAVAISGYADRLHVARGGALGLNGNYAAGILEGVLHFHPDRRVVLEETA